MEEMEVRGGDIVFITDQNLNTLIDFRYQQHFKGNERPRWHGQK
jgi:GTPase involved in cell partitioning and DNA repair